ncbi:protein windpipe-like [Teleopsis dalmanni]|uniref:protein windpipe-like n=1 Tax=Teleopsis dalmanni TaxID=139649 RepID=UPI0018CE7552|nr:protein windpipe-like [Teleopsis dalmanni]
MLRPNQKVFVALAALLLCTFSTTSADTEADDNFNCPEDCQCVIPPNTQHTFLHAKCKSLNGLKTKAPLQTTLPIHSIDLSYLRLARLSHSLDKLHDLTSIDLSHNELHEIGHLGRRIKKLNLKGNRITSGKLLKLPHHLQVLNLQHNDITYLPIEFTNFKNLHTLELSHNQINCSCETLEVRNWLQQHHVFMEHPVKCSYPVEVKGQSWLQVKQAHICEQEKQGWNADQDENELMMGDQPMEGSGDEEEEDELGKAYMPIEKKPTSNKSNELNDVEGSGDLGEMNMPLRNELSTNNPIEATTEMIGDVDEDDGSGSGAGILIALHSDRDFLVNHDFHYPTSNEKDHDSNHDDSFDNKPIEEPQVEPTQSPDIFGAGMGIFDGAEDNDDKTNDGVDEEIIVPAIYHAEEAAPEANSDAAIIDDGIDTETKSENIERAEVGAQDDNNATYFLLGAIVTATLQRTVELYCAMRRKNSLLRYSLSFLAVGGNDDNDDNDNVDNDDGTNIESLA